MKANTISILKSSVFQTKMSSEPCIMLFYRTEDKKHGIPGIPGSYANILSTDFGAIPVVHKMMFPPVPEGNLMPTERIQNTVNERKN